MCRSVLSRIVKEADSLIGIKRLNYQAIRLSGHRTQRGQASIELLLILLILVPLLFGGIELARGVGIRQSLDSGTAAATRALSIDPVQWDWATGVIDQAMTNNVLGGGSVSAVTVNAYDSSGAQLTSGQLATLPFGSPFLVEAECNYTPWLPLVGGSTVTIRVSHWGIVESYP
ncbi:MAG: TadE/TadG family type IV pilus assembly protein [Anaerolineales bacterium]